MINKLAVLFILLLMVLVSAPVFADSWIEPEISEQYSKNNKFRLDIVPAKENKPCSATLFIKNKISKFSQIWSIELKNPVCPSECHISDDGIFVVTLDDWGRMGNTENCIVVYGNKGELICRYALEDVLTEAELKEVPLTVSSRMWNNKDPEFDLKNNRLTLHSVKKIIIDLNTGKLM